MGATSGEIFAAVVLWIRSVIPRSIPLVVYDKNLDDPVLDLTSDVTAEDIITNFGYDRLLTPERWRELSREE